MEYIVTHDKYNSKLTLHVADVKFPYEITSQIKQLLDFPIKNYPKLKKQDVVHMLGPVNTFFSTLTDNEKVKLSECIITMHAIILMNSNELANNLSEISRKEQEISALYLKLDDDIGLVKLLTKFILDNIPLGDFTSTGRRPQDTSDLTFQEDEYLEITTITMLVKILIPIFSEFMFTIEKLIDTHTKEKHAAIIPEGIIVRHFNKVYDKLKYYIEHNIRVKFNESPSAIFNGKTTLNMVESIIENMLVRHLTNVDLHRSKGNIMKYIISSARSYTSSKELTIRKNKYNEVSFTDVSEESNDSFFEQDTLKCMNKTTDIVNIIASAIPKIIINNLAIYNLERSNYDKTLDYYSRNYIRPSKFNIFIISLLFSDDLNGSASIPLLKYNEYVQLLVCVQLLLLQLGYPDLALFLSALPSPSIDTQSMVSAKLKSTYKSSLPYIKCRDYFESKLSRARTIWDGEVAILVDELCGYTYTLNTPKWLCDQYNIDFKNKHIELPINIITSLCHFIDDVVISEIEYAV